MNHSLGRSRLSVASAMFVAALCSVGVASAQAQLSPNEERARMHFESGRSHFDQGNYQQALPEFETAYELSQRPALLFNIGATLERLSRYGEAADMFERFLASDTDEARRSTLELRVANLRRREGSGGSDVLLFLGIGALAAAGVGAVFAGVLGGLALSEENAAREGCFRTTTCTPSDVAAIDDLAVGSDIALVSAIVLGAAGGALVIVAILSGDDMGADAARLVPVVGPDYAGIAGRGSF